MSRAGASKRPISTVLATPPIPRLLLDHALPPLSHPCRVQHAVQSGRCADLLSVCAPLRLAVWFWLFAGQGAEEEGASEVAMGVFSRPPTSRRWTSRCDGGGAGQHWPDFCRGSSDGYAGEPSGGVRLDVTGAHQHHQLDHLIHLVVHLEQV